MLYYNQKEKRKQNKKGDKKMKTYTLYRAFDAITLTADELLAAFDEAEKDGFHIERLENEKVWGADAYMIYYW
jgi:hypothetical protein